MRIVRLLVLGIVSLTMLSGCGTYMKDRALDFVDMGGAKVSAGPQLLINVRASKVLQGGIGFAQHEVVSIQGRRWSIYEENRFEGGLGFVYYVENEKSTVTGNEAHYAYEAYDDSSEQWDWQRNFDRGFYEVGGTVGFFFFGLDLHFDALQVADFLAGIVTLDPAHDDSRNRDRRPVTGPPLDGYEELIDETNPDEG